MTKQIKENNEWIKQKLEKIWDENQADYFINNPARFAANKTEALKFDAQNEGQIQTFKKSNVKSFSKANNAFSIWESIRDDTRRKLKNLNLESDLQVFSFDFFWF